MFGSGHPDCFGKRFAIDVIHTARNGNNDPRFTEIRHADSFSDEVFEHQFGYVKICDLTVSDWRNGNQLVRGSAVEKTCFVSDRSDSMLVFPVQNNKRWF